jgi:morphogenetic protein associated with SpoVID
LKIHVVQKGDTLWELSKKYGVDFEELKKINSHLASPDMIMPGMKIRIPTTAKAVKKEGVVKEQVEHPFMNISPKPLPVIKEDQVKKEVQVKPEMPLPQMPQIPQMTMPPIIQSPTLETTELNTYMTFNIEESSEESSKEHKEKPVKEIPVQQPIQQPMFQPMPCPMPMIHCPCVPVHHCCGGMHFGHHGFPMFHPHLSPVSMGYPAPMMHGFEADCGCGGGVGVDPYMANMPQMMVDPNVTAPTQVQGMPTFPSQANMMFPQMADWQMSGFPTPPGFGGFRDDEEEESSD